MSTSVADGASTTGPAGLPAQPAPRTTPLLLLVGADLATAEQAKAAVAGTKEGYRVVHVASVEDAALTLPLAVCVLVELGGGADALKPLRELRGAAPRVPVLVVVDDAAEPAGLLALHEGAQDYLLRSELTSSALRRAVRYAVERRRTEDSIAERDRFTRETLDALDAATAVVNRAGSVVAANRAWAELVRAAGASPARCAVGISYYTIAHELAGTDAEWVARVSAGVRAVLSGDDETDEVDGGDPLTLPTGHAVSTRVNALAGGGAVIVHHDVTDLVAAREELSRSAIHDPLTGLPNRALLHNRIEHAIGRLKTGGAPFAVLFLDLDRFKLVNDSLGHDAGDRLLSAVATRLQRQLTPADTLARFGGDEFVVLHENSTPADAQVLAVGMRDVLAEPFFLDGQEIVVGASLGIVNCADADADPASVLRDASTAMYAAKDAGRSRLRVATAELHDEAMLRLDTEAGLRKAVGDEQFVLHFQPEVDAASRNLTSVEALVRWDHPVRGLLTPAEFLPVAHEAGLIVELGTWVLRNALEEAARWRSDIAGTEELAVSVNLASAQVRDLRLLDTVAEALRDTRTPARLLQLEITEDVMLSDAEEILEALNALRSYGVSLVVDDFGTGFSALAYLCALPVQGVKLDGELTRQAGEDRADTVVRGLVGMCHDLGLQVTAEGVEAEGQAGLLAEIGCDRLQGWHIGRAVDATEIRPVLRGLV